MTAEMTLAEAEMVIAIMTFAEDAALIENPAIYEALQALRPWRSALLASYLRERIGSPKLVDAVDPHIADPGTLSTREKDESV